MTPSYEERLRAAVQRDLEREITPLEVAARRGALVGRALAWSAGWAAAVSTPFWFQPESGGRSWWTALGVWLAIVAYLAYDLGRRYRAEKTQPPSVADPATIDAVARRSALCPACESPVPIRSSACPRCGEVLDPLREILTAILVVALVVVAVAWGLSR